MHKPLPSPPVRDGMLMGKSCASLGQVTTVAMNSLQCPEDSISEHSSHSSALAFLLPSLPRCLLTPGSGHIDVLVRIEHSKITYS